MEGVVVYRNSPPSPTKSTAQSTHKARLEDTTRQLFNPGPARRDPTISQLISPEQNSGDPWDVHWNESKNLCINITDGI